MQCKSYNTDFELKPTKGPCCSKKCYDKIDYQKHRLVRIAKV